LVLMLLVLVVGPVLMQVIGLAFVLVLVEFVVQVLVVLGVAAVEVAVMALVFALVNLVGSFLCMGRHFLLKKSDMSKPAEQKMNVTPGTAFLTQLARAKVACHRALHKAVVEIAWLHQLVSHRFVPGCDCRLCLLSAVNLHLDYCCYCFSSSSRQHLGSKKPLLLDA